MADLFDRVKVATATTGTSDLAIGAASTGFQTFADAGAVDGDVCRYILTEGSNWEIGEGALSSSGTVLARTTILASTNSDAKISLAGSSGATIISALTKADIDGKAEALSYSAATAAGTVDLNLETANLFSLTPSQFETTLTFSNPPSLGKFELLWTGVDFAAPMQLSGFAYDSKSFTSHVPAINGIFWKPDGTRMLFVDSNEKLSYVECSTPWDLSTAGTPVTNGFKMNTSSTTYGLYIHPDGDQLWTVDATNGDIDSHSISTAWSEEASFNNINSYDSAVGAIGGLAFNADGTVLFFATASAIKYRTLSTAWDVSTASGSSQYDLDASIAAAKGLVFSPDGLTMWVSDSTDNLIYEHTLTTAFNLASGVTLTSVTGDYSAQTTGTNVQLAIGDIGAKLYIADSDVYQYSTEGSPAPAELVYPTAVKWSGGTKPESPLDGEKKALEFVTTDTGTNWIGSEKSYVPPAPVQDRVLLASYQITTLVDELDIPLPSGYRKYDIEIENLESETDAVEWTFRTSTDGGTTFDVSGYSWSYQHMINTSSGRDSQSSTYIQFTENAGNAAGEVLQGKFTFTPSDGTTFSYLQFQTTYMHSSGYAAASVGGGVREQSTAVDALRLLPNTGGIESGLVLLYGHPNL